MIDYYPAVITGTFALLAGLIPHLISYLRRNDEYLKAIFAKKLEVYSGIIQRNVEMVDYVSTVCLGIKPAVDPNSLWNNVRNFVSQNAVVIPKATMEAECALAALFSDFYGHPFVVSGNAFIQPVIPILGVSEGRIVAAAKSVTHLCRKELGVERLSEDLKDRFTGPDWPCLARRMVFWKRMVFWRKQK